MSYDKGGLAYCSTCNTFVIPVRFSVMGEPFCGPTCRAEYERKVKAELAALRGLVMIVGSARLKIE